MDNPQQLFQVTPNIGVFPNFAQDGVFFVWPVLYFTPTRPMLHVDIHPRVQCRSLPGLQLSD